MDAKDTIRINAADGATPSRPHHVLLRADRHRPPSHGATDQQRASHPVSLSALQPGDIIFFGGASRSTTSASTSSAAAR